MVQAGRSGHHPGMPFTLLISDDSGLIRLRLLALLEPIADIDAIHIARTLAQTLESVQRLWPTLLILEIHLPDGNAIQLIHTLKQLAPRMQIAIFTNDANAFNRKKCLQAGVDWVFDKSSEFCDLLIVVQQQAKLSRIDPNPLP